MTENQIKGIAAIILLALSLLLCGWWYSHEENSTGIVDSKWVESNTSCSNDNDGQSHCTTTHTYFTQLRDGRVYSFFWGNRDWDQIREGDAIAFNARGMHVQLWGWRLASPAIFSFQVVEQPPS